MPWRNSSCSTVGSLHFNLNLDDSLDILGSEEEQKPFSLYFLSVVNKIAFFFWKYRNSHGSSRRQLQAINVVKKQHVRKKMPKKSIPFLS